MYLQYLTTTFSCRLNVLLNSESVKVWKTVMLNKCLNTFKSFTTVTTSCLFLFCFLVHFNFLLSLVTEDTGILLFRQLVLTPCDQSQPIAVRSHCVGDSIESGQSGGNPFWPESPQLSITHSRPITWWSTGNWLERTFPAFGLRVSPDDPENEEVMCWVFFFFFKSLFVLTIMYDYIITYIDCVINHLIMPVFSQVFVKR